MVNRNIEEMKILIGASSSKIFHLNEFAEELNNVGVETKVVFDADFSDGFPSRKIKYWIKPKNTFKKFGKATSRGVRFAEEQKTNTLNKKEKNGEMRLTKKEKKNKKYFKS